MPKVRFTGDGPLGTSLTFRDRGEPKHVEAGDVVDVSDSWMERIFPKYPEDFQLADVSVDTPEESTTTETPDADAPADEETEQGETDKPPKPRSRRGRGRRRTTVKKPDLEG